MLPVLDNDIACLHARECPISKTPCPGECVYADIMASITVGIVVFDMRHGTVLYRNQHARELLDDLALDSGFESLRARFAVDEDSLGDLRPAPLHVGDRILGYTAYRANGFVWVFIRDITEKARLEAVAEAVELTNSIGYVFAAVRHELGNPINSIKAALSLLRDNLERYPREVVADYLDRLLDETRRVEDLLRQLKSYSMYETMHPAPLELLPFLRQFAGQFGGDLRARGVAVTIDGPPGVTALADARGLQQVLINLLANAADAVAGVDGPAIRLRFAPGHGAVTLRVEDNGCGMSPDQLANVFKPFNTSKRSGTGLGLAICRKMLSRMGGTIAVDSTVGRGTVVTLTLSERAAGAGSQLGATTKDAARR